MGHPQIDKLITEPTAAIEYPSGIDPVVQADHRGHPGGAHGLHQAVVKFETLVVHFTGGRFGASPFHRVPEVADTQITCALDIVLVTVQEVDAVADGLIDGGGNP